MAKSRLLLVALTLMSTWMNVAAQSDGSFLARFLPKKTFLIHDSRLGPPSSRPLVAFGRPVARAPLPQRLQIIVSNPRTPTFSQLPSVVAQQSKGDRQSHLQQVVPQQVSSASPSGRNPKCGVLPPTGDCRAAFPRYYYNSNTDQCDCYLYGGCGSEAIDYSYRNLEECHASCLPGNREEGPVCKEVFQDDEEEYFDPPVPTSHQQHLVSPSIQRPNLDHIPDDVLLTLFANAVSPDDFSMYDTITEDNDNRD